VKAHLLYRDADFDITADLPANSGDLIQDVELTAVLQEMAAGDKFLYEISVRVMLASLTGPGDIRPHRRPRRGFCPPSAPPSLAMNSAAPSVKPPAQTDSRALQRGRPVTARPGRAAAEPRNAQRAAPGRSAISRTTKRCARSR
jgi:hypothetical protein